MSCNHVQQLEEKCTSLGINHDWHFRYNARKHADVKELLAIPYPEKRKVPKADYSDSADVSDASPKSFVFRSWACDPEFDVLRSQSKVKGLLPKCGFCQTNTAADFDPTSRDPQLLLSRATRAIDTLGPAATPHDAAMYVEALRWLPEEPDVSKRPRHPPDTSHPDEATCRLWLEEACFNGGECRHCIDEVDGVHTCPMCSSAIPHPVLSRAQNTSVRGTLFSSAR